MLAFQRLVDAPGSAGPCEVPADVPAKDMMIADEVAAFRGVERNTVYELASAPGNDERSRSACFKRSTRQRAG